MAHGESMGEMRIVHKFVIGTLDGKEPLWRHRWENNIKIDIKEIECEIVGHAMKAYWGVEV